jgi:hypothetical protein
MKITETIDIEQALAGFKPPARQKPRSATEAEFLRRIGTPSVSSGLPQPILSEARRPPVGSGHAVEGALVIAMPVQEPHQLSPVRVAERYRHVL